MRTITSRLSDLLTVKSLLTLMLTVTFIILEVNGGASEWFRTIYNVVVAFYFGTQHQKNQNKIDAPKENAGE